MAVARAVEARRFARSDEITQCLKLWVWNFDRGEQAVFVQQRELARVSCVSLHPVTGFRRNKAGRHNVAVDAALGQVPVRPKPVGPAS